MPAHEPHCPVPRAAMRGESATCLCTKNGECMTADQIMEFFNDHHLHIGDGIDNCSGEDYDEMRSAAAELSTLVNNVPPQGLYVFLVYTIDRVLLGAFGAREDADRVAKEYLRKSEGCDECRMNFNFNEENFWSWCNNNDEVTVEMTRLQ